MIESSISTSLFLIAAGLFPLACGGRTSSRSHEGAGNTKLAQTDPPQGTDAPHASGGISNLGGDGPATGGSPPIRPASGGAGTGGTGSTPPATNSCELPGGRDCTDCVETECLGVLKEANRGECLGARDCVQQYCLCTDFECSDSVDLCTCMETCMKDDDPDNCEPGLSAYLLCVSKQCPTECSGFEATEL